jgi:hypothetical protein
MIRRTLLLIAVAAIFFSVTRKRRAAAQEADHDAEAQWANEGGANAPASV